jgi:hypothetical protein
MTDPAYDLHIRVYNFMREHEYRHMLWTYIDLCRREAEQHLTQVSNMRCYLYRTERLIEVIAENEADADKEVQRELHRDETVICLVKDYPTE